MTEAEKMAAGMLYDPNDPEIIEEQKKYQALIDDFNRLRQSDHEAKLAYMKEVFAECGENCYIELPFHANWGGKNVHLGDNVYFNSNMTAVDDGQIYIGNNVLFGPNVTIATAAHPIDPEPRRKGLQYNEDVYIGDNAWICAGVIIVPGVRIGENTVIGAGSVVTKDIEANVVAVGNPCRVLRRI